MNDFWGLLAFDTIVVLAAGLAASRGHLQLHLRQKPQRKPPA